MQKFCDFPAQRMQNFGGVLCKNRTTFAECPPVFVARSSSKRRAHGVEFAQMLRGKRRGFCENFLEFRPATRKFNAFSCKHAARKAHDAGAAFCRGGDAFGAENRARSALKLRKIFGNFRETARI